MAYPDSWIYQLSANGICRIAYEETEHYQVTRAFLTRTKGMLKILLDQSENE
jgi:predicted ATPase